MTTTWKLKARQLLDFVSDDDIFQLAATVCKGNFEFSSKNEAITAIIAASLTPEDLLRKKKLKREYILRYIWEHGRSTDNLSTLPIKADKNQLIRIVLTSWNCNSSSPVQPVIEENDSSGDDVNEERAGPSQTTNDSSLMIEFGQRFIDWFYNLLNDSMTKEEFGAEHFYGNCFLNLRCGMEIDRSVSIEIEGGLNVAQRLKDFIAKERLMFQPNLRLPNGFQATQESHGAILLKSHGTVHRRPDDEKNQLSVIGPYEQTFLVIEDPQTKTWKIQRTALAIKAEIILTNPAIEAR